MQAGYQENDELREVDRGVNVADAALELVLIAAQFRWVVDVG